MNRMTKVALAALALTTAAVPMAAEAQSRGDRWERRDDRRDDRHDRRDDRRNDRRDHRDDRRDDRWDRRDNRHDDRWDRRDDRWDRRDDRREHRAERRWSRGDRNWYQGRQDFRDYRGYRQGYWYAPSYGYYRVEPRYSTYRWQRGQYLPSSYRSYYVRDPYVYGLGSAPRGYRYVHAGNDIVMIAIATGLIASVLSGVY